MTHAFVPNGKPRKNLAEEAEFNLQRLCVKPGERAVVWNGERRTLQPRVMRVLVELARVRPTVVSRERLIDRCWDGRIVGDDALNRCILTLRHLADEFSPAPFFIETVPRIGYRLETADSRAQSTGGRRRLPVRVLAAAAAIIALVAALILLSRCGSLPLSAGASTVLISAADDDELARAVAADVANKLARLQDARVTTLRFVTSESANAGPDLILSVGQVSAQSGAGADAALQADVTLSAAADQSILWSEQFIHPSPNLSDFKQQVAFTAARVLGCASEALEARLGQSTLKTYLTACAALADLSGRDAARVIPMLEDVVKLSPRFEAGWENLLTADVNVALHTEEPGDWQRLRRHVAAAKKVNDRLVAVNEAQIALLPAQAYAQRMQLANQAVALHPANARAYSIRAQLLHMIGRMKDGVVDARRAVQLDPLSTFTRSNYVGALGAAGLNDAAPQELREAERLWPGSNAVREMQFAFNLRYGDPGDAWDYLRSEPSADWMNARSYLEARRDRTPAKINLAIEDAQRLYKSWPRTVQHLIQVYGEFNREEELLELLLKAPQADLSFLDQTFRAPVVDFWNDPRSLLVAKRAGLLDYWRSSGKMPDFCNAPQLPYDCMKEIEKTSTGTGGLSSK